MSNPCVIERTFKMIISQLNLYNFRRFKSIDENPGLSVSFHQGLNALVGENDSGKSAVIDAIKMVLLTQSNEYIRVTDDDFYFDGKESASEFKIEMILSDFTPNEAKNFIEYLMFSKDENGEPIYYLPLTFRAWKEKNRIYTEMRAGEANNGVVLDGKARELLKCVYLRPLRDAEREMSSGRNSRISQILVNHPVFRTNTNHRLNDIMADANRNIEKYFIEDDGRTILSSIRDALREFNEHDVSSDASLRASDIQLKSILESLSLSASEIHPGLGELNLLFIAAELLLLQHDDYGGLRLALIEELEAHLHPQAQLRLIQYLQKEYQNSGIQIIISTHSTVLASKINLKNLILLKNGHGFDLTYEKTGLAKGDYLFLQRFLDTTKANLFFAKGVIMVEGDAENLLIPVIADIMGYPLEQYGISIVNVGSTAFLRYSRIFIRNEGNPMDIPVAVITDCDIKPQYDQNDVFDTCMDKMSAEVEKKEKYYSDGTVRGFISPQWTFEYCLAQSCLSDDFHKAIHYGKMIKNSDKYALTDEKISSANTKALEEAELWKSLSKEEKAYKIYMLMLDVNGKSGLKAIVAQCLSSVLKWKMANRSDEITQEQMFDLDMYQWKVNETERQKLKKAIESDACLKYIVDAIKYVVGAGLEGEAT